RGRPRGRLQYRTASPLRGLYACARSPAGDCRRTSLRVPRRSARLSIPAALPAHQPVGPSGLPCSDAQVIGTDVGQRIKGLFGPLELSSPSCVPVLHCPQASQGLSLASSVARRSPRTRWCCPCAECAGSHLPLWPPPSAEPAQ